jgi:hypothetical protein
MEAPPKSNGERDILGQLGSGDKHQDDLAVRQSEGLHGESSSQAPVGPSHDHMDPNSESGRWLGKPRHALKRLIVLGYVENVGLRHPDGQAPGPPTRSFLRPWPAVQHAIPLARELLGLLLCDPLVPPVTRLVEAELLNASDGSGGDVYIALATIGPHVPDAGTAAGLAHGDSQSATRS